MSVKNKKKYICIHGHFYQPPRENPWLEYLEIQDSAFPAHDWNERVFQECYAPNSFARITDNTGSILEMVNNYEWISFNFGPTLLSWMEGFNREIYQRILDADKNSRQFFSGHGNAIAQNYNHIIMPLANTEDKINQVVWGIKDFEARFGRKPEGMWLAETAVDLETLQILQENDIKFTVLSPYQGKRCRKFTVSKEKNSTLQYSDWQDVSGGSIDPKKPYRVLLPNGKDISVFFYDGYISKSIAFEKTLDHSDLFISTLLGGFNPHSDEVQLVHVATDGESYGHHKKFGDMTLAYSLHEILQRDDVELINYGLFLEKFPPQYEAEIFENSSWSCAHGVERWRSNCGCSTSGQSGWTQEWRAPLRNSLNMLRDVAYELYHQKMSVFCRQPDSVFHDYFDIIHSQSLMDQKQSFADAHARRKLSEAEVIEFFKLLEIRRNVNLMFTSCGWFFSEISGIETIQILCYAGRVIQLLVDFDVLVESQFLEILRRALSNIPEYKNGEEIYLKYVKPHFMDVKKIAIHYAITSLFEDYTDINKIYAYEVECFDFIKESSGINQLCIGHISVTSERTSETQQFQFAVLHYGETDFHCAIQSFETKADYFDQRDRLLYTFRNEHLTELVQLLTNEFGREYYALSHVLTEEKRNILNVVLRGEIDRLNQLIFYMSQKNKKIVEYCFKEFIPIPKPLLMFNEYTYQKVIEHIFSGELTGRDIYQQLSQVITMVNTLGFELNFEEQATMIQRYLEHAAESYFAKPESVQELNEFILILKAVLLLPTHVPLWNIENRWYQFLITKESSLYQLDRVQLTKLPQLLKDVKGLLKINIPDSETVDY